MANRDLAVLLRVNEVARRLMTIPAIGPVGETALAAWVTDPHQFRSGRQFAAIESGQAHCLYRLNGPNLTLSPSFGVTPYARIDILRLLLRPAMTLGRRLVSVWFDGCCVRGDQR